MTNLNHPDQYPSFRADEFGPVGPAAWSRHETPFPSDDELKTLMVAVEAFHEEFGRHESDFAGMESPLSEDACRVRALLGGQAVFGSTFER